MKVFLALGVLLIAATANGNFKDWLHKAEQDVKHTFDQAKDKAIELEHKAEEELKHVGEQISHGAEAVQHGVEDAIATLKAINNHEFCDKCVNWIESNRMVGGAEDTLESMEKGVKFVCLGIHSCVDKLMGKIHDIEDTPLDICTSVRLCGDKKLSDLGGDLAKLAEKGAEELYHKAQNFGQQLKNHEFCDDCQQTFQFIHNIEDKVQLLETIKKQANAVCFHNQECVAFIVKELDQLENVTPEALCKTLQFCSKTTKRSFDDWLHKAEKQAKQFAHDVEEKAEKIAQQAKEEFDDSAIVQEIKEKTKEMADKAKAKFEEITEKVKELKGGLEQHEYCDKCVDLFTNAKPKGDKFIEAAAHKIEFICFGNNACKNKIEHTVDEFKAMTPRQVCTKALFCAKEQTKRSALAKRGSFDWATQMVKNIAKAIANTVIDGGLKGIFHH